MLEEAAPMTDMSAVSEKLDTLRADKHKLKQELDERSEKLKLANTAVEKFETMADTLAAWLAIQEERLAAIGNPAMEEAALDAQLKEAQVRRRKKIRAMLGGWCRVVTLPE